jgi:hypothetical protein
VVSAVTWMEFDSVLLVGEHVDYAGGPNTRWRSWLEELVSILLNGGTICGKVSNNIFICI